jgi:DNA-binding NarL/FixJ family response regulator
VARGEGQQGGGARTCLVADDHPSVLRTVTQLLGEWGWTIVASTNNGDEALRKIEQLKPRVALLDLRMRGLSGLEVAKRAPRLSPDTAIVIYSGLDDRATVREVIDAGVHAFVVKEASLDELHRALDAVTRGQRYIDPVVSAQLLDAGKAPSLTKREREVLRLLAAGSSYDEVGAALFISSETVRTHVAKVVRKLGVRTRTQAVAEAVRTGLIS